MDESDDPIHAASRRLAGINALRKLRELVDEENAHALWKARWARRLGTLFVLIAVAALAWVVRRAP